MSKLPHHQLIPYQFKPGQSGNPSGRPKNIFSKSDVEVAVQRIAKMTLKEIEKLILDPDVTNLDASIASIWQRARQSGDFVALEFLLSRAVGKVKEEIENTSYVHDEDLKGVPTSELVRLIGNDK